ncbi:MAG: hypothetical protein ACRDQ0_10500, partial [Pseudonocardia sp.]
RTPNGEHDDAMARRMDGRAAAEAVVAAATALGIAAKVAASTDGPDVVVELPNGQALYLEVTSTSLVSAAGVEQQAQRLSDLHGIDVTGVVVADRITAEARQRLTRAGLGWLDLRGHLRLTGPGLLVDADVPASSAPVAERSGIVGDVGVELAALLLLDPGEPVGVRAAAAALSRAPSSISEAFRALNAAELVDVKRRPVVPELFWELASRWNPVSRDVASLPDLGRSPENDALRLSVDEVGTTTGWALTDTVAAAVFGAPVGMRADHPRDFYVPDQRTLRRAVQVLGPAIAPSSRLGRVRLAPTPMVCARRIDATAWANERWPLANPLFVALDLAQDPGRGREILDGWTPMRPWHRVW